ncbi:MAG TPA: adenylate/guanylate cyclase domain-containing protein [Anaerolineales bacterium]|nr:adenylate/guanylate cyclase domain-containing protein [Anaerolineales bacterium]
MQNFRVKRPSLRLILLFGVAVILLIIQIVGFFPGVTTPLERVEYSTRDLMMRVRGVQPLSGDVAIVAIDDFSFNWTNYQWPWPRAYLAKIVDQVNQGGAKVVGLDVFLFEPGADAGGDEALAKSLAQSPAAVSVMQIFQSPEENSLTLHLPLPVYRSALHGIGITSFTRDDDAVVRSVRAYDTYSSDIYYHWAFDLARLFLNGKPASAPTTNNLSFNDQSVPLQNGQLLVNFNGPAGTYPTYSAADVADGVTLQQNPNAFKNKIVLIGATTVTLQDVYPTPFSGQTLMPGVEVVANAVDTLISQRFLREPLPWIALLVTLAAAFLAMLITRIERPSRILALLGAVMIAYLVICYIAFVQAGWFLPVAAPETMIFLGVILPTMEQAVSQEIEKRRVRNLFTRFIAPEMVDQLIATQDINSLNKRTELTILFSDIRGFTTMSEKLPPDELVALLNSYLESMTAIIHKYGGTVDKYEGDAIVAFFGEPVRYADHALRAVSASVEMLAQLPGLTEKWIKEGRPIQRFDIGIGLNSGDVFVGLVGSAQRINYTVIGDNANLASRLQDLTKTYQWPILISESTYQQVKDEFETEWADSVIVKGKSEPVNVYKVLGHQSERVQPWQK